MPRRIRFIAPSLSLLCALSLGGQAMAQTAAMDHADHQGGSAISRTTQPGQATLPGQDAFGAIQEILAILEADPETDWSKVDLEGLRQHLIDMNEVTLHARVTETPVAGGSRFEVTGEGRVAEAIGRMVVAHGHVVGGMNGWTIDTAPLPDGAIMTVTAEDPAEAVHIHGLGFIGIMATGAHHQIHHLALARGESPH